jgi:hypothetical protein
MADNNRIETLGINESSVVSNKAKQDINESNKILSKTPEIKKDSSAKLDQQVAALATSINKGHKVIDNNTQQGDDQQEKEQVKISTEVSEQTSGETQQIDKASLKNQHTKIPALPLKNILSKLNNEGLEETVKVNPGSALRAREKKKLKYERFEDDPVSSYSSSLPPSEINDDVIVNISAIEIDKNDISIYNSPREEDKQEEAVTPGNTKKKILLVLAYILLFMLVIGVLVYVLGMKTV